MSDQVGNQNVGFLMTRLISEINKQNSNSARSEEIKTIPYKQVEDLTDKRDILNKYTIFFSFRDMHSLNIEI